MKTVRDHIASQAAMPSPPPGATYGLVWEPYGPSRARWALVDLDAPLDADAGSVDGPADLTAGELSARASALLGYPVGLSSRIELDGETGYYVTPAGGER